MNWHRCTLRQVFVITQFIGLEWSDPMNRAASELFSLSEEHPHEWPVDVVLDIWEE